MEDLISVVVLKSTGCLCTFRSRFWMFPERAGCYAAERTWDYDLWPLIMRNASCNPRQGPRVNSSAFNLYLWTRPSEDSNECWSSLFRSLWQILPTDLSLPNDLQSLGLNRFLHACFIVVNVAFGSDNSVPPVFFTRLVFVRVIIDYPCFIYSLAQPCLLPSM